MKTLKPIVLQTRVSDEIHTQIKNLADKEFEGNESQAVRKLLAEALEKGVKDGLK